jgi:hypothetical protein
MKIFKGFTMKLLKRAFAYCSLILAMNVAYAQYPNVVKFINSTSQPLSIFKNSPRSGTNYLTSVLLAMIPTNNSVFLKIEPECLKATNLPQCGEQGIKCIQNNPASQTCTGFTAGTVAVKSGTELRFQSIDNDRISGFDISSNDATIEFKIDKNNNIAVIRSNK